MKKNHTKKRELDGEPRDNYFEAIEEACDRGVSYHRIIQVREAKNIESHFDASYKDHFLEMIKRRNKRAQSYDRHLRPVLLDCISPCFPTTFLIIDEQYLLWQLNELTPGESTSGSNEPHPEVVQMRAVIIIYDKSGHFIKDFKYIWGRCLQHAEKIPVTAENLGVADLTT